jgi:hypothetical protein
LATSVEDAAAAGAMKARVKRELVAVVVGDAQFGRPAVLAPTEAAPILDGLGRFVVEFPHWLSRNAAEYCCDECDYASAVNTDGFLPCNCG